MKPLAFVFSAGVSLLALFPLMAFGQGPLTPPGPPGPTMRTLLQVEPRTPISSIPFTITNSGAYYLTTNLDGGGGMVNGIIIGVGGVTIDLNGFSIAGCTTGVGLGGSGLSGVALHNGIVRNCSGAGIDLGTASRCRLEHLLIYDNGGNGASVGPASLVNLCVAAGNNGFGLSAGNSSDISHSIAQTNRGDGIVLAGLGRIADNIAEGNGLGLTHAGIHVLGNGARVENNHSHHNAGNGYRVDGTRNLVVKNSACENAAADYNLGMGNDYGQIVAGPGAGFVNSNPWANFSCPPPAPTCTDMVRNGSETDVDCGGGTCPPCNVGLMCGASTDCVSGRCSNGFCQPPCPMNQLTCNNACVNPMTDVAHCGACNTPCGPYPNATAACNAGVCTIASCNPGFANCNGLISDGCEVNTATSLNNCGGCGLMCPNLANTTEGCVNSTCVVVSCSSGFRDCNNNVSDGCERNTNTDVNNCGNCGQMCLPGQACTAGTCQGILSNGTACTVGSQCSSGNCVDGFCCNSSCNTACRACSQAKTGVGNGTCANIPAGSDPDAECAGIFSNCNGAGACQ